MRRVRRRVTGGSSSSNEMKAGPVERSRDGQGVTARRSFEHTEVQQRILMLRSHSLAFSVCSSGSSSVVQRMQVSLRAGKRCSWLTA